MSDNQPNQLTAIQREVELLERLVELREQMKNNANITINRFEASCGITTVYNGCTIVGEPKKRGGRTTSNPTASISTSNLTGNGSATDTTPDVEPPPPVEETPRQRSASTDNTPPPPPEEL